MLAFRTPVEVKVLADIADIGARNESRIGAELRRDVLKHEFIGEPPANVVEDSLGIPPELVKRSGGRRRLGFRRRCCRGTYHGAEPGSPVLVQTEVGVDSTHPIKESVEFTIGVDDPDVILLSEIAADTAHRKVGTLTGQWTGGGNDPPR